ncbi:Hypothetical_protein [Hexamita inflata]|uniref:Hypothetical_protein n=1 Tax=Hexamita inflata TaxID=28002 RepID=A0AA86PUK2_9EUKA|nr:Hypothetical protein HINF_LOCUS34159 [Hexamita inflata]
MNIMNRETLQILSQLSLYTNYVAFLPSQSKQFLVNKNETFNGSFCGVELRHLCLLQIVEKFTKLKNIMQYKYKQQYIKYFGNNQKPKQTEYTNFNLIKNHFQSIISPAVDYNESFGHNQVLKQISQYMITKDILKINIWVLFHISQKKQQLSKFQQTSHFIK